MSSEYKYQASNAKRVKAAAERRKTFLALLRADPSRTMKSIREEIGMAENTLTQWRKKHPEFVTEVATIRSRAGHAHPSDVGREIQAFKGDFIARRKYYFGFDTPWHQHSTVLAYHKAKPGSITIALMPPEHGKTSLTEDDLSLTIADDHQIRITCISEGANMARKMSRRLMKRLGHNSPTPLLVSELGPFAPTTGEGDDRQPWGVDYWSVYGAKESDERDYTFATGGWRSAIAGTRADRLHLDDPQSLRSLNATEEMWDVIRQDMLSRPGEHGTTTANGTRVGERDIWDRFDVEFEGEHFYTKVEYPALVIDHLNGELKPLWEYDEETGVGYTLENLENMRRKVGEEAWWRNYMQKPRTSSFIVFKQGGMDLCKNSLRTIDHTRSDIPGTTNDECWITVDPSIGGRNVVMAMHPETDKLLLLDVVEETSLSTNADIAASCEGMILRMKARGWNPTMLVIEAMAFQKGLMEDHAFLDLERRYGTRLESHMTGTNKYDDNIGLASMASTVAAGQIDMPYGDEYARAVSDQVFAQMHAWKPTRDKSTGKLKFARGSRQRMDQLMTLWFGWIWWAELRTELSGDSDLAQAFKVGGLPYAPTRTGLLVPVH